MKVLFIGGTGVISSACAEICLERGVDLWLLNRGRTNRPVPEGSKLIKGDIRDVNEIKSFFIKQEFDAIVDWVAFTVENVENDLELFKDKTAQYIFISSASAYETPPSKLPVTEKTPLSNPFWGYSRNKIACEERLIKAYREEGFPVTIVRPSHTYDRTMIPIHGGYNIIDRMRKGKKIIIHGDGTSLWTLTHNKDFAKGFVGLLGNSKAIGEDFHITSDAYLSWNQICGFLAEAAGVKADIIHIPSDFIAYYDTAWGESLLGDKSYSMIFDNEKIKNLVTEFEAVIPFSVGAHEIIEWYDADISRRISDTDTENLMDMIIKKFESGLT